MDGPLTEEPRTGRPSVHPGSHKEDAMRIRGRSAVVLTLIAAGALAAGLFAFAASAAADPPACDPGTSATDNKSCVNFQVLPSNPGATAKPASLFVHTHTNYAHPGNKAQGGFAKTVTLLFDNDWTITAGTVPTCTTRSSAGRTSAAGVGACGPGAGASHNAYLSPATGVSGRASTAPPSNFNGCMLVFSGPLGRQPDDHPVHARDPGPRDGQLRQPRRPTRRATRASLLNGTITPPAWPASARSSPSRVDTLPLPLDDFTALLKRGNYFKAKCSATPRIRGTFAYSGTGQAADTSNATQTCEVAQGSGPPTTKITKAKIKNKRKKATFKFTAGGQATGFECQLTRKHHRAPDFKKCHSPKVYKHLKRGNYTFKVRAVGPGGTDATPARKSFKIKKRR